MKYVSINTIAVDIHDFDSFCFDLFDRAQETLPAFNTFRRPSTELQNAAPAAEVK